MAPSEDSNEQKGYPDATVTTAPSFPSSSPVETVPDTVFTHVLSFLPTCCYLPVAQVCRKFLHCYQERMIVFGEHDRTRTTRISEDTEQCQRYLSEPLVTLFPARWDLSGHKLSEAALEYFQMAGWDPSKRTHRILRQCAMRGDVHGIEMLWRHLDRDSVEKVKSTIGPDLCSLSGAAGHLECLRWLREVKQVEWNAVEVYRDAADNLQQDVIAYVEVNADENLASLYGEGMAWH